MLSRILPWIRRTWVCQVVVHYSGALTPSLGPGQPRCRAGHRLWQWDRGPDGPPLEQRLPAEGFYQPGRLRPNHQKVQRKTIHLSWYVRYSHPAKNRKKVWSMSGISSPFLPFWLLYGTFSKILAIINYLSSGQVGVPLATEGIMFNNSSSLSEWNPQIRFELLNPWNKKFRYFYDSQCWS